MSAEIIINEREQVSAAVITGQSVAAVYGTAKKGTPHLRTFCNSGRDFITKFGSPLVASYGAYAALEYLKETDKLYYVRIASLRGSDPVTTANTDLRAMLAATAGFATPSSIMSLANKVLRLRFDSIVSQDVSIVFTNAILTTLIKSTLSKTMDALVSFINGALSHNYTLEPRWGFATVTYASGSGYINIYSHNVDGYTSKVEILAPSSGTSASSVFGWTDGVSIATGSRTVLLEKSTSAASATSATETYNLGVRASVTSNNAQTYNLGAKATASVGNTGLLSDGYSYQYMGNSFVPSVMSDVYTGGNNDAYQLARGTDFVLTMNVDGYEFDVPVEITNLAKWPATWTGTLASLAALNQLCSDINTAYQVASRYSEEDIAYVISGTSRTTIDDGKLLIQSKGRTATPHVVIPFTQNEAIVPIAPYYFAVALGLRIGVEKKFDNILTIQYDSGASNNVYFDKSTLYAANPTYKPELMSNANVVNYINTVLGESIATVQSTPGFGFNLSNLLKGCPAFAGTDPGSDYTVWSEGLGCSTNPYYGNYASSKFGPSLLTTRHNTATSAQVHYSSSYLSPSIQTWLKFTFTGGTKYAICKFTGFEYSTGRLSLTSAPTLESTNINASATTFLSTLASATTGRLLDAKGGYALIYDTESATPSLGDVLTVDSLSCRVVKRDDATAGKKDRYTLVVVPTTTATFAPAIGSTITNVTVPGTVGTLTAVYFDRDVNVYIDNSGPLSFGGLNVTDIEGISYSWYQGQTWQNLINVTTPGSEEIKISTPPGSEEIDISTNDTVSPHTVSSDCRVSPSGAYSLLMGLIFGTTNAILRLDNLPYGSDTTDAKAAISYTLVAKDAGSGSFSFTSEGSYAYIDKTDKVILNLINPMIGTDNITTIIFAIVIGSGDSSTLYSNFVNDKDDYSHTEKTPLVTVDNGATFSLPARDYLTDYSWGTGWNTLDVKVDGGSTQSINFNNGVFVDQSAATAIEVIDAINSVVSGSIASPASGNKVVLTSPTPGTTGSMTLVSDNAALDFTNGVAVVGAGSPYLGLTVDSVTIDMDFSGYEGFKIVDLSAATAEEVVDCLNYEFDSITPATVDSHKVKVTSPTSGSSSLINITEANTFLGGDFSTSHIIRGGSVDVECATFYAVSEGTWANDDITVRISDEPLYFAPGTSRIDILYKNKVVETYREISPDPSADGSTGPNGQGTFIETAIGNASTNSLGQNPSQYVYVRFDEDLTTATPDYISGKFVGSEYILDKGMDGLTGITVSDYSGSDYSTTWGRPTGFHQLDDNETVTTTLQVAPGITDVPTLYNLASLCENRGDSLAIIDPPYPLTDLQIVDWSNGANGFTNNALNSKFLALYSNWQYYLDTYNNVKLWVPPSIGVLRQYAQNDRLSQPWYPVAGTTRGVFQTALKLYTEPNKPTRDIMYDAPNCVNPIAKFASYGYLIWGNRTTYRTAAPSQDASVRRTINYIKTAIRLSLPSNLWSLANDKSNRNNIADKISNICGDVMKTNGIVSFKVEDVTSNSDLLKKQISIRCSIVTPSIVEKIVVDLIITSDGNVVEA